MPLNYRIMALGIMVIILLLAAVIGGYANFLLPANNGEDGKSKLRRPIECIILGLTATLMVPVFLELAQSKLLENVRPGFDWEPSADSTREKAVQKSDTVLISSVISVDSTKKRTEKTDTTIKKSKSIGRSPKDNVVQADSDTGKNYWLWAAYCVIAAAAGFRFINMLINNVVKQEEINTLKAKTQELEDDKKKEAEQKRLNEKVAESKELTKLVANNAERMAISGTINPAEIVPPVIGPITHPDDPQKGRFGGKSVNNFRRLCATVKESILSGWYDVVIWVESTDEENHPLTENVIFYIHDSFRPNVFTITPVGGRATDDDIVSYGAFTVGAIADNGATLLELDLAEDSAFPKQFRES